jgi:hypothetical protein
MVPLEDIPVGLPIVVGLNAVIVAVTEDVPRILTVKRAQQAQETAPETQAAEAERETLDALPFGPLDPAGDRTLELGLRRWVREQTGIEIGYLEQLYTFGSRHRDPIERAGGPRVISIAYLALVREEKLTGGGGAVWRDWYRYFPWEDWRGGRPALIDLHITPALNRWFHAPPDQDTQRDRRERCDINFGLRGAPWVPERVLERYELMYEVGLVAESPRDRSQAGQSNRSPAASAPGLALLGLPMAFDHRRMLATALGRLRGKLKYRPVVFELLPATFTLLQLQRVVEALAGIELHKQNLRRLVEKGGLVEGTGHFESQTGGRPAELFRFRREVLRERRAPGVGLPGVRHGG